MTMKYFEALGPIKEKLLKLHRRDLEADEARNNFRKKHRGEAMVIRGDRLSGLVFKKKALFEGWKYLKKTPVNGHAIPTVKKVREEMDSKAMQRRLSWDY